MHSIEISKIFLSWILKDINTFWLSSFQKVFLQRSFSNEKSKWLYHLISLGIFQKYFMKKKSRVRKLFPKWFSLEKNCCLLKKEDDVPHSRGGKKTYWCSFLFIDSCLFGFSALLIDLPEIIDSELLMLMVKWWNWLYNLLIYIFVFILYF